MTNGSGETVTDSHNGQTPNREDVVDAELLVHVERARHSSVHHPDPVMGTTSDSGDQEIRKLDINSLHPHEQTIDDNLTTITDRIKSDGKLELPILVDRRTKVILDGHHRWAALLQLGAERITAMTIEYQTENGIELAPGPNCPLESLTRKAVIDKGLSDSVFPPKSTRHRVLFPYPTTNTPLDELTDGSEPPSD